MINIKIEHRGTGLSILDHEYTAYSSLYILEGGDYFECDSGQPRSIIYTPYIKDNISPYITMHGDFIPSAGGLYATNDEEELNIVFNVNYDGYTPPPSGGDPEDPGDTDSSAEKPISFSFTVKSYKSGTLTEVADDFVVEKCYYVERYDEGTIGEYGLLNLKYYTNYEFDGKKYNYTEPQTYTLSSTINGYKLSGFFGIENGSSLTGEKDGINDYTFDAYYIDNDFTVNIDAKGIDRSQVVVQNPNTVSIYELPYTRNYPNTTLLLEALTSDNNYMFDYWEVNGEKYTTSSKLSYNITQNTTIYCYFKEKDIFEDDKIITNSEIYSKSGYVYGLNNNQCPTKLDILNNDKSKTITISGSYLENQCVKYSDVNINKKKITLRVANNGNHTINDFKIIVGYINNSIENKIFEKTALEILGGNEINSGDKDNTIIDIDLSPNSNYNSVDLKNKQIYIKTELKFNIPNTVRVYVSNDSKYTKKLIGEFSTTNVDHTFTNTSYKYEFLINSEYPVIYVEVN